MKVIAFFIFTMQFSIAQIPTFNWAKKVGNTNFDESLSIAVDNAGNVYTTGYYQGTVDFDPGAAIVSLTAGGSQSGFILKLDAVGNFVWVKDISGSFIVSPQCIKLDASGNIYTTGAFNGIVDFNPGAATNTLSSPTSEIFILKLDANGNYIWAKSMDGTTGNAGYAIDIDASGNVFTTGSFKNTTDFDPNAGTATLTAAGLQDVFISKLDVNGNYVWAKKVGGTGDDYGRAIAIDASGTVYTTGQFMSNVDFDPSASTSTLGSFGNDDAFILSLSNSGNFVWAKQLGGVGNENSFGIAIDGLSNIYTTGSFSSGSCDFDPGIGTYTLSASSTGIYVSKLNASGTFIWAKQLGNGGTGRGIAVDNANDVYITGHFIGTGDFNPGVGIANFTAVGNYDVFISKLDATGNYSWTKQIGGSDIDYGFSIAVDASLNVCTTGDFIGTADFNLGATAFTLTAAGSSSYDGYIYKLGQCSPPSTPSNTTALANQKICANNATTLSAVGSGTINWFASPTSTTVLFSGSNYTTGVLSAGVYTYYAEAITCTNSSMRTAITVTVNSLPTVGISTSNSLICVGQTASLTANGALAYLWNTTSTNTVLSISPVSTTNYTVIGTDINGCKNSSSITQSVSLCTALENRNVENVILIYPNPTKGNIIITGINETAKIIIFNAIGELLRTLEISSKNTEVDFSNYTNGIYLIKVISSNNQKAYKLIKQ